MSRDAASIPLAISLDYSSRLPLHRQLYDALRAAVLSGRLSPGFQLPSTRQLASDLQLSRNTVLNAYDQLLAEGYLEGHAGSGTFVARAIPDFVLRAQPAAPVVASARPSAALSSRGRQFVANQVRRFRRTGAPVPFRMGIPALDEFPFAIWSRLFAQQWKHHPAGLLPYGDSAGYLPLRQSVATYLQVARAVHCRPEQVIITSGAQQALDLAARVLIDPGQPVCIEDPGYIGARIAFQSSGARLIPVPVGSEGLEIAKAQKSCRRPRVIYVTPSHQYPLGTTMTLGRRLELLQWAQRVGSWIIEDDYDSEYRYSSRPIASLQGLDTSASVLYAGTFSKVLFPSLRLGYIVVPPSLLEAFVAAKAAADGQCPALEQAVLAEFMAEGHFGRHIRRMRKLYEQRQTALINALEDELPGILTVGQHDAGMHVVACLPPGVSDRPIAELALRRGVELQPLSSYGLRPVRRGGFVMGYAGYSPAVMRRAVAVVGDVVRRSLKSDSRPSG